MARPNYSVGKRNRENERERKREEKAERRRQNRAQGGATVQITTAEEIQGGIMRGLEENEPSGGGSVRSNSIPSRLFVGGLSQSVSTADLRAMFETYGAVDDAIVVMDRDLGDSRGFGFVTMADRRDATVAIQELSGRELDGRTLVVRPATERGR